MSTARRLAAVALLVAVAAWTGSAAETLPENLGLAARYPGDQGLAKDSAVVFADDVETSTGATLPNGFASDHRGSWNNRWDHAWGGVRITREAAHVHAGQQALELRTETPASLGTSKYFSPGFDRLFLRYYIEYDDAFPGAHHIGAGLVARAPGIPHAHAGIKADGVNKFDVLLDLWGFDPAVPAPGNLVAYVYHMDQQHEWGEQFYPSGRTQPGTNAARKLFGLSFVARRDFVPARGCRPTRQDSVTAVSRSGSTGGWRRTSRTCGSEPWRRSSSIARI